MAGKKRPVAIFLHDYIDENEPISKDKAYRVEFDDKGLDFIEAKWDAKMNWLEIYASDSISVIPMVSNRVGISKTQW